MHDITINYINLYEFTQSFLFISAFGLQHQLSLFAYKEALEGIHQILENGIAAHSGW